MASLALDTMHCIAKAGTARCSTLVTGTNSRFCVEHHALTRRRYQQYKIDTDKVIHYPLAPLPIDVAIADRNALQQCIDSPLQEYVKVLRAYEQRQAFTAQYVAAECDDAGHQQIAEHLQKIRSHIDG